MLDALTPAGSRLRVELHLESRFVSIGEVRRRLDMIRAEEEARYEHARGQRERLQRLAEPAKLDDVLAAESKCIEKQTADTTQFTEAECARLTRIADRKRSWNPLTRAAASKEEQGLHAMQRSRFEAAVTEAMRDFEKRDAPRITQRVAADERRYRQWVTESLAFEERMHEARWLLRNRMPHIEHRLSVVERAGASQIALQGDALRLTFHKLAGSVEQQYLAFPEALRTEAERCIRKEQRVRDRSRESMSFDR